MEMGYWTIRTIMMIALLVMVMVVGCTAQTVKGAINV